MTAQWLTSKLFGGSGSSGGGFGGFINSIKNLFGLGSGSGVGATPPFSPANFAGGGASGAAGLQGSGSSLAGGLAVAGMLANLVGGAVGGRAGSFISNIGSGVAMGATIGSIIPGLGTVVGAVIGGGIGLLQSILGGDPKRKADKKENLPKLQQGFTDAFKEFQQLLTDVRLGVDPDSALSKGRELRAQIASGFGIEFQSKKYRKESQNLIRAKLAEIDRVPDGMMAQLITAVAQAKAASERQKRILPEFAVGNYFGGRDDQMSDMRRSIDMRRGYINGGQIGVDRHLGLFADGEAILNQLHQKRVNEAAGFDVLAYAGIPNYPRKPQPIKKFADGAFFGDAASTAIAKAGQSGFIVQPNFKLVIEEGTTFDEKTKAYLESDDGVRTQVEVQKKLKSSGKIK